MEDDNLFIFISIIPFIFIAGIFIFIIQSWQKKMKTINTVEINFNDDKISIPLLSAFSGRKGFSPRVAFSHNNFNPKLILTTEGIEYKIIFKEEFKNYTDVETVDILEGLGSECLILLFRDTNKTFSGNIYNKNNLKKVLQYLKEKGCQLTPQAELITSNTV